ncbi:MAG: hypothetical protein CMF50_05270 [Legionellales bacterium]|nr:hypothetical protein [Legionellales bacterium]|tara:strand:+ start:102480 stop:103007 length:528 start_codon:yes stop_codon:yes gene_type:complete
MKKIILTALSLALPGLAMAMQCPPPNAFHHSGKGEPWVLDDAFKKQGWQDTSNTAPSDNTRRANNSEQNNIPNQKYVHALVNLYSDGYWTAQCSYYIDNNTTVSALTHQPYDAQNVPQPAFSYQSGTFICNFQGNNVTKCQFPMLKTADNHPGKQPAQVKKAQASQSDQNTQAAS